MTTAASIGKQILRLPPLPTVKEILNLYNIRATKHLSQNFLLQEKVINKIVNAAGKIRNTYVCEVGPGPGGITRSLLEKGTKHLTVVEKDKRFAPCLEQLEDASCGRMQIIFQDVLSLDGSKLFPEETRREWEEKCPPIHVIGNLPFNISTPLIIRWLRDMSERKGFFSYGRTRLTLTFQKEIAERMIAQPFDAKQRCRLSVMCQYLANVEHVTNILGSFCVPVPEVDIGVVHFEPLVEPLIQHPFKLVEKVARHVFHYRRKFIFKGFETLFPGSLKHLGKEAFQKSNIKPMRCSYELTMHEFQLLCDVYAEMCIRIPELINYEYRIKKSVNEWQFYTEEYK